MNEQSTCTRLRAETHDVYVSSGKALGVQQCGRSARAVLHVRGDAACRRLTEESTSRRASCHELDV